MSTNPDTPLWRPEDVLRWSGLAAVGAVMTVTGWYLSAGEVSYRHQTGAIDLAISGCVVAAAAHVVWLMRGRRAIGERRRRVLGEPVSAPLATSVFAQWPYEGRRPRSAVIVGGDGLRHFHRSDCPLAADRSWPSRPVADQEAAGRTACGVCHP
jgi:hypothetical protein